MNIRNRETEKLAEAVAKLMGETKTQAVMQALRDRTGRRLADDLDAIALHCSRLPVQDSRSADEILEYDERGLPR